MHATDARSLLTCGIALLLVSVVVVDHEPTLFLAVWLIACSLLALVGGALQVRRRRRNATERLAWYQNRARHHGGTIR